MKTTKGKITRKREKVEREKVRRLSCAFASWPRRVGWSPIVEAEGCGVVHEEVDKAIDDDVAWPC